MEADIERNTKHVDKLSALKATALFSTLDDAALTAVADRSIEQHLSKNEILFLAGENARGLYVIVDGSVRAYRVGADGREQVIHVERAPASVAELPVFDEGDYPSNVAAEEDTTVLFIDKRDVQRLCLQYPQISLAALRVLAGRLRRCAALVETLSLQDVDRRLARLLLAQATESGTRDGKRITFELHMTHQQIASHIGSVREVVSRAFARLQQHGHIQVDGKRLTILDAPAFDSFTRN